MSMYNLLATLSGANIDYVLVGGLAVTLPGYQRLTMDVLDIDELRKIKRQLAEGQHGQG